MNPPEHLHVGPEKGMFIAPPDAPEFDRGGWVDIGMAEAVNTTDKDEVVGFGPLAGITREVVVNITFTFTEFAKQVSVAFGKLTEAFLAMARAGTMISHKSPLARKAKAIERVNAIREKREKTGGFTGHTTAQAKAMHAAYRRRRR